jgi:serine protease
MLAVLVLSCAAAHAWMDPSLPGALGLQPTQPLPYDPTSITVRFTPGIDRARIADVLQQSGCVVAHASEFTPGLMDIRIPAGADFRQWIGTFAARADVAYAEPTYIDRIAFTPNDPRYGEQWHFPMIGMSTAWDILPSRGTTSTVVCVLDSGVAYETYSTYIVAPDLSGVNFVSPRDVYNGDDHPNDDNRHGTHVCGTIAQRTNNSLGVAGMADGVSIMPVKSLNSSGTGTHTNFSDGIHWAVDHGAHIINYSAGGSDSATKSAAVDYAYDHGVLLIAAAGNSAGALEYPGRYDHAFAVAAVDSGKNLAYYSCFGTGLDISAPGGETNVVSSEGVLQQTFASGHPDTMGYYFFMGTSMATPHVTGLAALLRSQGIYTSRDSMKSRIQSTAEDLGAAGYDTTFGYGLIRADRALSPWLSWAGTAGYTSDGVDPNTGDPVGSALPTTFTFKVKYQNGLGYSPWYARCIIQKLVCDPAGGMTWRKYKNLGMALESGTAKDGAIYSVSTTLANEVVKYRFLFKWGKGSIVPGPPNSYVLNPKLRGRPHLCWTGKPGWATDGVDPNAGPPKTKFRFRVLYTDSWGTAPSIHEVLIQRNGSPYVKKAMKPLTAGSYRTGKIYDAAVIIGKTGTYQYRFRFRDGINFASGAPAGWTAGPSILIRKVVVTSLAAAPTAAGAEVTFNLTDAADVTATVMNVAGRPIRTIATAKPMEAGLQTLLWDRKGENGLTVPAGLYMIGVTAHDPEGGQTSGMATISLR